MTLPKETSKWKEIVRGATDDNGQVDMSEIKEFHDSELQRVRKETEEKMTLEMVSHEKPFFDAGYEKGRTETREEIEIAVELWMSTHAKLQKTFQTDDFISYIFKQ